MRKISEHLEKYRVTTGKIGSDSSYGNNGCFQIPHPNKFRKGNPGFFTVIISDQCSWEHVSVSLPHRCPTWDEMCHIKSVFFKPEECVVQYHPREQDYVNCHRYCLHMWKPLEAELPIPPSIFVGHKEIQA